MTANGRYRLQVRFGDDLLEAGFTAVPNLFLTNYRDLGIGDGAALWVVHILRFKWTEDNPYPRRSSIPMNANRDTQKRYAAELRRRGLLFTRRIYWTSRDNPPRQDLVGRIRALEYDFTSLFHNLVRISRWKAEGRPLDDFRVEIPPEIAEKVVDGYFHHVPARWEQACREQVRAAADVEPRAEGLGGENHTPGLGGENRTPGLGGENHPLGLGGDFQPVENHPHYNKDTHDNKKQGAAEEKEQQQQDTWPPSAAAVVVVSIQELRTLSLGGDQVLVSLDGDGSRLAVAPISDVVQHELRRQRIDPSYRAEVYYSVEHALGEGPDDWTEEELTRIRRAQAIERELRRRYERIGAFTLEEALCRYFTRRFTAHVLRGKPPSERERIEGWIAYVRRQRNLTNPAGFLRTVIESGEAAPGSNPGSSFPARDE